MAFRVISVALEANDARLTSSMKRAASTVDEFGRRTNTAARTSTRAANEMTGSFSKLENVLSRGVTRSLTGFVAAAAGGYAAGRALNAAISAVVGGAVQLDTRMRNVNSISHLTEQGLGRLTGQVVDLSRVLPQSANNLAEGLYDISSSGFQGADAIQVLTASARAATAGLTDTSTAAAAIAGVLNAYGDGAAHAKYVSDSLFQTVIVGVLSFGDLAQGIGQVVGTAAAANVSIDELGAAIATMTRAGIVAPEAFTAANQLLAQIIQPGEALTALFHKLGYESGAAALQADGLHGVMERIRKATGGNVTAMSALFTDIRSLKGAFALVTDQGRLYRQSVTEQQKAHDQLGASSSALAEQMKSVSVQWDLFKNRVKAAAIETGQRLLPALLATTRGANSFGDTVGGAAERLGPTFHNIAESVSSAAHVIGILVSTVAPLARILLNVVGVPLVAMLEGVSRTVAAVTGFFERNRVATVALATVLTVALLPALTASVVAFGRMTVELGGQLFLRAALNAAILTSNIQALGVAGLAAGSALTLGLGAALYLFAKHSADVKKQAAEAGTAVEKLTASFNALRPGSLDQTTDAINDYVDAAIRADKEAHYTTYDNLNAKLDAAYDAQKRVNEEQRIADANVTRLAKSLGVAESAVRGYAAANNIDLTRPWTESSDEIDKVTMGLAEIAAQGGTSLSKLSKMTDGSIEAMQALAEAVKATSDAVRNEFANATNVIQQFDPEAAAGEVQAAQDKLLDAQRRLRDEQAQYNAEKDHSVSSSQQLAAAHREVADAAKELDKAQRDASEKSDLGTIYRRNIEMARSFVHNMDEALARGLDPQMVMRLLQAGPQQAGPILDALVQSHSNRLIRLANASENSLARISERAVRLAQFTARAVNAPLEDQERLARELPKAFALEQLMSSVPDANGAWLARKLGITPRQVRQIAEDFGVTLTGYVQSTLNANPVKIRVKPPSASIGNVQGGVFVPRGAAAGGHIAGPGTATSDSILARLSNGEFVMRAAAVNYYGASTMAALNRMTMPRYAEGGAVGRQGSFGGGAPRVVVVHAGGGTTHSVKHEINIGEVRAHDYADFKEQMYAERRVRAVMP